MRILWVVNGVMDLMTGTVEDSRVLKLSLEIPISSFRLDHYAIIGSLGSNKLVKGHRG